MQNKKLGLENSESQINLGGGAQFWIYISPENETAKILPAWRVTFSQGDWVDSITSENPNQSVKATGLSGVFQVKVELLSDVSKGVWTEISPLPENKNEVGCNLNCASMVGLIANSDTTESPAQSANVKFWTVWDAICDKH